MRLLPRAGTEEDERLERTSVHREVMERRRREEKEVTTAWLTPPRRSSSPSAGLGARRGGDDTVSWHREESQRHPASRRLHLADEEENDADLRMNAVFIWADTCWHTPRPRVRARRGRQLHASLWNLFSNPLQGVKNSSASEFKRHSFSLPVNYWQVWFEGFTRKRQSSFTLIKT